MLEIHGQVACPFAWRVRFAAHEKGVPYQWIPWNVPHPDPRVARDNPQHRSPLVVHDGLTLIESLIIEQYVDEAFDGPPLQAATAQDRARARMMAASFDVLGEVMHGQTDERNMTRMLAAYAAAHGALQASGRDWLHGERPGLADIALFPLLWALERQGHRLPPRFAALGACWARAQQRDGFRLTAPAVVKMELGA